MRRLGKLALFLLLLLLCDSPILAQHGTSPHSNCSDGHCICPERLDSQHYAGFCEGIGCQDGYGCTAEGCPYWGPRIVEDIEANNHLQAWMVDGTLPAQLSAYSKTWAAVVEALQRDFNDTTIPLANRRKLLLPNITHLELGLPAYEQGVIVESRYDAQTGVWALRLVRGLNGDESNADILVITPHKWMLHNEASGEHIGDGKVALMPHVLDFPQDQSVETQAAARFAKAKAAKAAASPAGASSNQ